jgi:serine/threonine-protein kinase RsbW
MNPRIFHHKSLLPKKGIVNQEPNFDSCLIFESTLRNSLNRLESFLSYLQKYLPVNENRDVNMIVVLSEAITNCVIHGNKFDQSKFIHVSSRLDAYSINFSLEDEGEGFDYQSMNQSVDNLAIYNGGRGILIMRYLSDGFSYSNGGRRLDLSFNLK